MIDLSKYKDLKALSIAEFSALKKAIAEAEKEKEQEIEAKLPEWKAEVEAYVQKKYGVSLQRIFTASKDAKPEEHVYDIPMNGNGETKEFRIKRMGALTNHDKAAISEWLGQPIAGKRQLGRFQRPVVTVTNYAKK